MFPFDPPGNIRKPCFFYMLTRLDNCWKIQNQQIVKECLFATENIC